MLSLQLSSASPTQPVQQLPSTVAMAPKKRTRRVAGAAAEPQQMVESLREGLRAAHDAQPQIVLAQITTLLEPNPALAQHVLRLLQTGAITMERHSEPD